MGIFEKLGIKPLINASGTITRVGGAWMTREALDAINMNEASAAFIAERLHAALSEER